MKEPPKLKILFLCTGNSARSILAEYLLRAMDSRFETFSAGAAPTGKVHPMAERVLREAYGIDTAGAASQSIRDFEETPIDVVVTVCDHARDTCPVWPYGSVTQVHWGSPDPAAHRGSLEEVEAVFRRVADQIKTRLERLSALDVGELDRTELATRLRAIGESDTED